jgi:hypothetical protein
MHYDFRGASIVLGPEDPAVARWGTAPLGWGFGELVLKAGREFAAPGVAVGTPVDFRQYTNGNVGTINPCVDTDVYNPGDDTITLKGPPSPDVVPGVLGVMFGGWNNLPDKHDQRPAEFIRVKSVGATTVTFDRPLTKQYFKFGTGGFGFAAFMTGGCLENVVVENAVLPEVNITSFKERFNGLFVSMAHNVEYRNILVKKKSLHYSLFMKGTGLHYSKCRIESPPNYNSMSFDQGCTDVQVDGCFINNGSTAYFHMGESSNRKISSCEIVREAGGSNDPYFNITSLAGTADIISNNLFINYGVRITLNNGDKFGSAADNPNSVPIPGKIIVSGNMFLGEMGPAVQVLLSGTATADDVEGAPLIADNLFQGYIPTTSSNRTVIRVSDETKAIITGNSFDVDVKGRGRNFVNAGSVGLSADGSTNPDPEHLVIRNNVGIEDFKEFYIPATDIHRSTLAVTSINDAVGYVPNTSNRVIGALAEKAQGHTMILRIPIQTDNQFVSYLLDVQFIPGDATAGNVRLNINLDNFESDGTVISPGNDLEVYAVQAGGKAQTIRVPNLFRKAAFVGFPMKYGAQLRVNRSNTNVADTYAGDLYILGYKITQIPAC